jgi:two-component system sensor histidine kinase YesM
MLKKPGLLPLSTFLQVITLVLLSMATMVLWLLYSRQTVSIWIPAVLSLVLAALLQTTWRYVVLPYRETEKLLALFAEGYTLEGIHDITHSYSPGMRETFAKFNELLDTNELLQASKRQEQFLALQNQINPHFLYNTLEGIRSEALSAGLDTIAQMTEALSTFFRYTISTMDNLVTVEDELANIENYFTIQQYRFGKRLNLHIDIAENERFEILAYRLPKLTLQPIVENSIIHGLECKVSKGTLRITLETTPSRLLITISDDGVGMEASQLEELNRSLAIRSLSYVGGGRKRGGIAIVNVNNRIKLLFGEQYGITITSTPSLGTDVEIVLPRITAETQESR